MRDTEIRRLWMMQLRLECKWLDSNSRIVRLPGDDPDPIPLCSVTRLAGADHWSFSSAADASFLDEVQQLHATDMLMGTPAVGSLARNHGLSHQVCSTSCFTAVQELDAPVETIRTGNEAVAVVVEGRELAWARSSRSNEQCAELWVYTDPGQRGQGHGRQAAISWAAEVAGSGRIASYSHLSGNHASKQLAARLGVTHLFDVASLISW